MDLFSNRRVEIAADWNFFLPVVGKSCTPEMLKMLF